MHNNNNNDRDYDDANAVAVAASRPVLNTWLRGLILEDWLSDGRNLGQCTTQIKGFAGVAYWSLGNWQRERERQQLASLAHPTTHT